MKQVYNNDFVSLWNDIKAEYHTIGKIQSLHACSYNHLND